MVSGIEACKLSLYLRVDLLSSYVVLVMLSRSGFFSQASEDVVKFVCEQLAELEKLLVFIDARALSSLKLPLAAVRGEWCDMVGWWLGIKLFHEMSFCPRVDPAAVPLWLLQAQTTSVKSKIILDKAIG